MKSALGLVALIAALSFCNLTDKLKQGNNSNAGDRKPAEAQNESPKSDPQQARAELTVELMKLEYIITTASYAGDASNLASTSAKVRLTTK